MHGDDIEDLKRTKIEPQRGDRLLPTVSAAAEAGVTEAFGGSGQAAGEPVDTEAIRRDVIAALKQVYDPEIPVNIYDLGLIYGFEISAQGQVEIEMTLTAPACPVAGTLVEQVAERTGAVAGVSRSHVKLVWDPPWNRDRMSEEAMLELGLL